MINRRTSPSPLPSPRKRGEGGINVAFSPLLPACGEKVPAGG